ncbi:hypothetical protein, partial [Thermoleptolyngbya sp.]
RTGHLNRHRADFLVIVMVSPNFPMSRAIMHYRRIPLLNLANLAESESETNIKGTAHHAVPFASFKRCV